MNADFETPMAALFLHLQGAAQIDFTADAQEGAAVLSNVSSVEDLFPGLPLFGPGVPTGTVIASIDADAAAVTLSDLVTEASEDANFTTGFQTTSRRLQHWQQVTAQPAMFLRRVGTTDEAQGDGLVATTIEGEIWIYSQAGADPEVAPDIALSNLDRMVREALSIDEDEGRFTIGGLVHWCRIEGRSDYSPGDQQSQGISRIPVRITLP